mmetsp:Transcript_40138/g.89986  ORF Transcript_40138/g.89986 Transcript_40138/m.89986 type:complete len:229 (-) Transcript_40138:378-1064(-)
MAMPKMAEPASAEFGLASFSSSSPRCKSQRRDTPSLAQKIHREDSQSTLKPLMWPPCAGRACKTSPVFRLQMNKTEFQQAAKRSDSQWTSRPQSARSSRSPSPESSMLQRSWEPSQTLRMESSPKLTVRTVSPQSTSTSSTTPSCASNRCAALPAFRSQRIRRPARSKVNARCDDQSTKTPLMMPAWPVMQCKQWPRSKSQSRTLWLMSPDSARLLFQSTSRPVTEAP